MQLNTPVVPASSLLAFTSSGRPKEMTKESFNVFLWLVESWFPVTLLVQMSTATVVWISTSFLIHVRR